MALMQKSPVLLYLVFVGIACVELKVVRWQALGGVAAGLIIVLTTLQSFMLDDWNYFRSFSLLTFRMAQSFPYYMSVYPELLEYAGVDLGLHLFGIGEVARDNLDVFNYMYPESPGSRSRPRPSPPPSLRPGGNLVRTRHLVLVGFVFKVIAALKHCISVQPALHSTIHPFSSSTT